MSSRIQNLVPKQAVLKAQHRWQDMQCAPLFNARLAIFSFFPQEAIAGPNIPASPAVEAVAMFASATEDN
jgi:hypothetical protein